MADIDTSECCHEDCNNEATQYDSDNTGFCTAHAPDEEEGE